MKRERPIIFSSSMIHAILDGRKSQTRRLVTPGTSEIGSGPFAWSRLDFSDALVDPGGTPIFGPGPYLKVKRPDDDTRHRVYPRYEVGMRLWVRETFGFVWPDDCADWLIYDDEHPDGRPITQRECNVAYRATGDPGPCDEQSDDLREVWTPSIFMPRHASRITLEITKIRCERVQQISEEDARAEGVTEQAPDGHVYPSARAAQRMTYRAAFGKLWNAINRKRAPWETNPFVWILEFRKVEAERRAAE